MCSTECRSGYTARYSGAVIVICPVCNGPTGGRAVSVTTITRNCVYQSSPGSDHLQLIKFKFWPSCAPGKGVCGGANIFGSALLRPVRSVCVSPSAFSLAVCFNAT